MNESKSSVTVYVFTFALVATLVAGYAMENTYAVPPDYFYGGQPAEYNELESFSTDERKIKAIVKGSIYETGENMTVFGACFDGDGYLLEDSTANFDAWYPNGTSMMPTTPMIPILSNQSDPNSTTGRFRIHVTMTDTIGTYLTQFNCTIDTPGPNDDYAIAFGEWQNPLWVKRIGDTQQEVLNISSIVELNGDQLTNISTQLTNFSNDVSDNFTTVLNTINSLSVNSSADTGDQFNELRELVHAISTSFWVIDESNPTYSLSSGTHNYAAVDMLSPSNVHAVSLDGFAVYWDGETWTERNVTGFTMLGVSAVPTAYPYAWYAGEFGSSPAWSLNGDTPQTVGGATGNTFVDVEVFKRPNNPEATYYGYLMTDSGEVWFTDDSGTSFSNVATMGDTASHGYMSQVVDNVIDGQTTDGYRMMFGMGDSVMVYDGVDYSTTFTLTGQEVRDVGMLYEDKGWVLTYENSTSKSKIYEFDGSSLTLMYQTNGTTSLRFEGLGVVAQNDLWAVTSDPSVYYHYNGRTWEYARFAFSEYVGVTISFDLNLTSTGLKDVAMFDGKNGYAVGSDGLIMKFRNHHDDMFDQILDQGNITQNDLANLTNIVINMNSSIATDLSEVLNKLDGLNQSLEIKFNQTLGNLSLMSLVLNDVYDNTVDILTQLGFLESQINLTIELQNQTLEIVEDTAVDVEELVNKSRRPRAWITQ
jgi:hypothetical protein